MNPKQILQRGCEVLDPIMTRHGFTFVEGLSGQGCGGLYASGEYVRGDRRLGLFFRYSLGLVTYHIGELSLPHLEYMRALLGRNGENQYPGFSDDPLDGFRHLKHDLENFCTDFLSGTGDEFKVCVERAAEQAKIKGFAALPNN
jgi:hypothetical protein